MRSSELPRRVAPPGIPTSRISRRVCGLPLGLGPPRAGGGDRLAGLRPRDSPLGDRIHAALARQQVFHPRRLAILGADAHQRVTPAN